FARRDRRQSDGRVQEIRRGNDHRVHLVALRDLFIFGRGDFDARLLARLLQRGRVAIAERDDSGFRTQGEAGKMVLQRDAAAADDGDADWFHEREPRVCRSIRKTQAPPLAGGSKSPSGAQSSSSARCGHCVITPEPEFGRLTKSGGARPTASLIPAQGNALGKANGFSLKANG